MKRLVVLLTCLGLFVANGFAQSKTSVTHISGRVLGYDGQPLKSAHVHLATRAYFLDIHRTVQVAPDGSFDVETDLEGYYDLVFSGVGHDNLEVPVWFYEPANLRLEIRLGTYNYAKNWDKVAVKNLVDGGSQDLRPGGDGTFTATVSTKADSLVYVMDNVAEWGGSIADLNASTYLLDTEAIRYHSVASVSDNQVTIVFDPTQLPPAGKASSLRVLDTTSTMAKLLALQVENRQMWQNVSEQQQKMLAEEGLNTREADRAAVRALIESYQASIGDSLRARLTERMSKVSNPVVRKAYLVTLVNLPGQPTPEFAKRVLAELSPLDPVWGMGSQGITKAIEATREPERHGEYLHHAAMQNPVEGVRGELLFDTMLEAYFADDKANWEKYYDLLMRHAPHSGRANYARKKYNPNPIAVGQEVPDFSIASFEDENKIYSKESMKGTYYFIDFWATWCSPCIAELPRLHRMYEKYRDKNFTILSLSFDVIPQDIAPFREEQWPMPWHHAFVEGGFKNKLAKDFDVSGIPKPVLVNPEGRIVALGEELMGERLARTMAAVLDDAE